MSIPTLQQGIQSIQQGKHDEGARLLKIALKDETLAPNMQAVGWMWLAETTGDNNFKIQCYQRAAAIDPSNQIVNERLSQLLAQQLPPRPPSSPAPENTYAPPVTQQPPAYQQPLSPSGDSGQYRVQNPQPRQTNSYPQMDDSGQFIPRNPQPRSAIIQITHQWMIPDSTACRIRSHVSPTTIRLPITVTLTVLIAHSNSLIPHINSLTPTG